LNFFRFNPGGAVTVEPVRVGNQFLGDLFKHVLMFWTGIQRDASSVLAEQRRNIPDKIAYLQKIRGHAHELQTLATGGKFEPEAFGKILDDSWRLKRQLAGAISSQQIDENYERALKAGAEGGKICGAGAGGFLLFIVKPEKQGAVRQALAHLPEVSIGFEAHGSRVLLPFEH
jgi:D-glycero-alpha-D-manno-heptose-7-phosphate kinase